MESRVRNTLTSVRHRASEGASGLPSNDALRTTTAVSNNNKCITKSRPTKFYSTLCHTAKRTQRYNLIRSTQNNSTSVEQNCQPLAQNKFNNCPPTQNLTVHLLWPNKSPSLEPPLESL